MASFSANGASFDLIADTSGEFQNFTDIAIDENGSVVFAARLDELIPSPAFPGQLQQIHGIFSGDGNAIVGIVDNTGDFYSVGGFDVSSNGTIAFEGEKDVSGDRSGVFLSKNNVISAIIESTAANPIFGIASDILINNNDVVAFQANVTPFSVQRGLLTSDGSTVTLITDESVNAGSYILMAFNDNGAVKFDTASPPRGIFVGDGTTLTSLNASTELFVEFTPDFDLLPSPGDALFGSTLDTLFLPNSNSFRGTVNSAGQTAFIGTLTDGRVFVAIRLTADVVQLAEVSSLSPAAVSIGAALDVALAGSGSADLVAFGEQVLLLGSATEQAGALSDAGPNFATALYDTGRFGARQASSQVGRHLDSAIWSARSRAQPQLASMAWRPLPTFAPVVVIGIRDLLPLASGLTAGSETGETTLFTTDRLRAFVATTGEFGDVDGSRNQSGFDYDGLFATTGIDYRINHWLLAGVAGTYGAVDADIDDGRGGADTDSYSLSGSAQANFMENFFLDATVSHTWTDYDTTRRVNSGGTTTTASGDTDGTAWSVMARGSARFPVGSGYIGPIVKLEYMDVDVDGYTETGAGGLSLTVGDDNHQWLAGSLGARAALPIELSVGRLIPRAGISLVHAFKDDAPTLSATFSGLPGTTMAIPTDGTDDTYLEVEAGISLDVTDTARLSLGYQGILANRDFDRHAVSGRLLLRF
ncbi:MAG: autotransporter outer membrane beta-barrel domain-containing protein [Gammaproteobacteria bacterium]|nr:autotransporter outer membrane beta-barrel domain-containing protein [Gammaproteobacteria bacterium]